MIVDADVHISPTLERGISIGYEELVRRMDRAGVDKALAWLQPPYRRETDLANAYVYEAAKRHPDRILGFGWADPNLGVGEAKDTVRRCIYDYGFYGVKLNGAQTSWPFTSAQMPTNTPIPSAWARSRTSSPRCRSSWSTWAALPTPT
jgi:hypothetical protein